ncbi:MAG: hypothetical protein QM677_01845 [Microbacterium sp.]
MARVHAAAMKYPDAVFVGESGAALRGLPVFGEPRDVHVVLPRPGSSRTIGGVRVHTATGMPAFDEIGGVLVAAAAEIAVDIARSRHHAIGLTVAGSALRVDRQLTTDTLIDLNARRASSRGRRHATWALERASAVPESPLEHVSIAAIEWLGFPRPELQKWILGPDGHDDDRLDFWWEPWHAGGEADGFGKLGDNARAIADALRRRGVRDARLLARGVRATAHWGWDEVVAVDPLRATLLAAGLPIVRPADDMQLRSMRRAFTPTPGRGAVPASTRNDAPRQQ